jgi:hypothetical protein
MNYWQNAVVEDIDLAMMHKENTHQIIPPQLRTDSRPAVTQLRSFSESGSLGVFYILELEKNVGGHNYVLIGVGVDQSRDNGVVFVHARLNFC